MAQSAISDEINRHLEAVLSLSRLGFIRQLVSEAELCIDFDQTSAAVILAGIALEELSSSQHQTIIRALDPKLQDWRELRNRSAHPAIRGQEVDRKRVAAMVLALRRLLDDIGNPDIPIQRSTSNALTNIRGKYASVPTSVEEFLRRKHEDMDVENRTWMSSWMLPR